MRELDPKHNYPPANLNHIHIMGICGTGMAALAGMLQERGYKITGSDNHVYPPMSDFLRQLGIAVFDGYAEKNLTPRPDLVIVGNVITKKNIEAQELAQTDIPYMSFPQALAHFFIQGKTSLVIAGTHGKTTTCSLLATALHRAQLDPSFMIGGIIPEFTGNFRLGDGNYFVSEGDEYDTAFFDKGSKFLHYRPNIAVITSIEFDHADIFKNLDAIKSCFKQFVKLIPPDGLLIANFDDVNVREISAHAQCKVQSYGLNSNNDWSISDLAPSNGLTNFTATYNNEFFGTLSVKLPGQHNCLNSLAVTAIMNHLGVPVEAISQGLSTFGGVKRRQEVRGIEGGVTVIDDFAHHPTAVKETLSALRMSYPSNRLIVVFEPRTNTSRRAFFQKQYVSSFGSGDLVCIREPVPLANVEPEEHFSSSQLANDLQASNGIQSKSFPDTEDILNYLQKELREGDVVAILSNGGFDNIHERLLHILRK